MPRIIAHIRPAIENHGLALIAATIVLLGFIWMITYGSFGVFENEGLGQFYDAQAASLLAGHWDVPPGDIFLEGYYHNGKAYGYYGFVPALPRMLLNKILPRMNGAWSRLSAIIACAVTLACCNAFLHRAKAFNGIAPATTLEKSTRAVFLLLAGLGSTVIYLGSRAFLYHEALLWAVALAMACYVQIFDYLADRRWRHLVAACALAYLSFFTRISTGVGPILALLLLGISQVIGFGFLLSPPAFREKGTNMPATHVLLICTALTTIAATYAFVNHAKFGTSLQAAPMALYEQVARDPAGMARMGGNWMSPGNIPTTANAYLSPGSIAFHREFPWVFLQEKLRLLPGQHIDGWGPFSSITTAMPVFVILGLLGLIFVRPYPWPAVILLGSLAPIMAVLAFSSVDNRYLHEFFPLLIMTGAVGVRWILSIRKPAGRTVLVAFLLIAAVAQIYANCAYALVYQRLLVYDHPKAAEVQFRHWQSVLGKG